MTTDILDGLRKWADETERRWHPSACKWVAHPDDPQVVMLRKAADELQRLRSGHAAVIEECARWSMIVATTG